MAGTSSNTKGCESKAIRNQFKTGKTVFMSPVYVKRTQDCQQQPQHCNFEVKRNPVKDQQNIALVNQKPCFTVKENYTQTSKTILQLAKIDEMAMSCSFVPKLNNNQQNFKDFKWKAEKEVNESNLCGYNSARLAECSERKRRKQSPPNRPPDQKVDVKNVCEKLQTVISGPQGIFGQSQKVYSVNTQPIFLGDAEHNTNKEKHGFTINQTPVVAANGLKNKKFKDKSDKIQIMRITSFHNLFQVCNNEVVLNVLKDDRRLINTIQEEPSWPCRCSGDIQTDNEQAISNKLNETKAQKRFKGFNGSSNSDKGFDCHVHPIVVNIKDKKSPESDKKKAQEDAPFVRNIISQNVPKKSLSYTQRLASIPIKCQLMRNSKVFNNFKSKSVVIGHSKSDNCSSKSCNCNDANGKHKVLRMHKGNDYKEKQCLSCSTPLLGPQVRHGFECHVSPKRITFMSPTLSSEQKSLKAAVESVKNLVDVKLNNYREKEKSFILEEVASKKSENMKKVASNVGPRLVKSEEISSREHRILNEFPKEIHQDASRIKRNVNCNKVLSTSTIVGSTDSHENCLYAALLNIKSTDWNQALKGLADLVEMARGYNHETFLPFMAIVNQRLLELLRSPRSHVCRTACQLSGHYFATMRDTRRPEFDDIVNTLLYKTADANKFIKHDANLALDEMVTHIPTFHAIRSVCAKGPTHRNALVRCATVRLIICAVVTAGPASIMHSLHHEASRRRIINNLLYFLDDKNLDIRKYAERLYKILAKESTFDHYLKKYLDKTKIDALMRLLKFANKNPF